MVSLEKAVTAKITKGKEHFEILVDPEKASDFRKGKPMGMENVLAVNTVFKDAKKGDRAGTKELETAFGTADVFKIAEEIIKRGELQLTTEQRRKMVEERRKQIADMLAKLGVNPQTKLPHPPLRIMNAMDTAGVHVDPNRPAEAQMEEVLTKIQPILPISLERLEVAIKVPIQWAGKASALIRGMAPIKKEEWKSDCWIVVIEIPAGLQADIYSKLNKLTGGQIDVKVLSK